MRLMSGVWLECESCGWEPGSVGLVYSCKRCGEPLTIKFDERFLERSVEKGFRGHGVWRYRSLLPFDEDVNPVTLQEGGTPMHPSFNLSEKLGVKRLFLKNEGLNPTASFKDRGMTVATTDAKIRGAKSVICASTGNTAASVAAYAARAGMRSYVLVPAGFTASGKLSQAVAYGARIVKVVGGFDDALRAVLRVVEESGPRLYLLNSVNPYRIEGQKTLSFEVWEQLGGGVPDWVVVPVGNAGNITAIWKGFKELLQSGLTDKTPRLLGVQAVGASPLVRAFLSGGDRLEPVKNPETIATAIRIGNPVSWRRALKAVRESKGHMLSVSDDEIVDAQRLLARLEGVFVEPASAASLAGLIKALGGGVIPRDESVVLVLTGHGLKDPQSVDRIGVDEVEVPPDPERILEVTVS